MVRKGTREVRRKKGRGKTKGRGEKLNSKKCDTLGIHMRRVCLVQKNIAAFEALYR